ncbi:hypothetical protein LX36DRAFT_19341 [Colletotrichum falcatum]|nr:hypothetical protein LX36DRAFT_19341 [Colletotrichum falcatum]
MPLQRVASRGRLSCFHSPTGRDPRLQPVNRRVVAESGNAVGHDRSDRLSWQVQDMFLMSRYLLRPASFGFRGCRDPMETNPQTAVTFASGAQSSRQPSSTGNISRPSPCSRETSCLEAGSTCPGCILPPSTGLSPYTPYFNQASTRPLMGMPLSDSSAVCL